MLPITGVNEVITLRCSTRSQRVYDELIENVRNGTNTSGGLQNLIVVSPISSLLDRVWLWTGTATTAQLKPDIVSTPTSVDSTHPGDKQIALLQAYAVIGNVDQFTSTYQEIDLGDRPVKDIIYIVQLALSIGAIALAKDACVQGLKRYTDNSELNKMYTVLAPPRISVSKRKSPTGIGSNTVWLKAHGDEYHGKWVALRAGTLVAVADSVKELLKVTGDVRGTDLFILSVH